MVTYKYPSGSQGDVEGESMGGIVLHSEPWDLDRCLDRIDRLHMVPTIKLDIDTVLTAKYGDRYPMSFALHDKEPHAAAAAAAAAGGGGADLFNVIADSPVIHSSFPYLDNFTFLCFTSNQIKTELYTVQRR